MPKRPEVEKFRRQYSALVIKGDLPAFEALLTEHQPQLSDDLWRNLSALPSRPYAIGGFPQNSLAVPDSAFTLLGSHLTARVLQRMKDLVGGGVQFRLEFQTLSLFVADVRLGRHAGHASWPFLRC
jgi:hypothetical protein